MNAPDIVVQFPTEDLKDPARMLAYLRDVANQLYQHNEVLRQIVAAVQAPAPTPASTTPTASPVKQTQSAGLPTVNEVPGAGDMAVHTDVSTGYTYFTYNRNGAVTALRMDLL